MNDPLVSVIIPVYGVEKYLNKCVDSVVNQTYKKIEIILVDDGSPDQCPRLCDEWVKKDERVRVLHKSNGGLSDARNAGIKICKGEYICFVDSDDWVEPTLVQLLLDACLENQVLLSACGRYDHFEGTDKVQINKCPLKNEIVDSQKFVARMLIGDHCDCSAWGKMYHKSLWNTVQFPQGRIYEDVAIMYKVVLNISKVATVSTPLYNYRIRSVSIVQSSFSKRLLDYPFNTRNLLTDVKENYPELYIPACWTHTQALTHVLSKIARSNRKVFNEHKKECSGLQKELKSLKAVWKKSDLFSRKDRLYIKIYSNRYISRCVGVAKRFLKRFK